ncbi:MAG: hypothetical protein C0399_12485, partial [Syntrophus sp. (in: bacteria)]|nr:hypothetical protein [Syntrophus sp. (in: bacteria)]
MRDQHSLTLRIISAIVLSFFCWTSGGIFDIAWAVINSERTVAAGSERVSATSSHSSRSEEKFGRDMRDIEDILSDNKSDHESKRSKIRSKKTEIDADDVEIRKRFR